MTFKNIFKLFLIAIFVIGIVNFAYADSGPTIGESQAKSIAQNYLSSHNLPYKVTTATELIQIKNRQTGSTKWVTPSQWDSMTGNNKFKPEEDPNFEWEYAANYNTAWKVATVDSQGKGTGSIWVNAETGKITKTELKSPTTQSNSTKSNNNDNTTQSINTTAQVPQEATNNNTWIIAALILVVIVIGAGYWMYSRR